MKPGKSQEFRATLEAVKRQSMAQLLLKCARLVNERALAQIRQEHGVPLRTAHTLLFPHIDVVNGSRLTDLAQTLGVSKQAVGQLVDDLVGFGMLERRPDPEDRRAKRICYTNRGRQGLFEGLAVLAREEQKLEQAIGTRRFRQLLRVLTLLETALDPPLSPAAPVSRQQR